MSLKFGAVSARSMLALTSIILAGAAGTVLLFGGAEAAGQGQPKCGDTITTDTTLHKDLVNCPNNGIVIGADHVTLNLNGHRIDGNEAQIQHCPGNEACDIGILNRGHDGITVKGGRVRQFGLGVLAYKTTHLRLQRLAVRHNHFSGVVIAASTRAVLNKLVTGADGLTTDQSGMAIFDTDHLLLRNSKLRANGDIGLYVENLDDSRLHGNTFSRNPEAGTLLSGNGNLVAHNRFRRNGDGAAVSGNDNVIRRNVVTHSAGLGLQLEDGKRNRVARNRVLNTGTFGISVASYGPVTNTVLRGNHVRDAGRDGLRVRAVRKSLKRTRVRGNSVARSGDDGIDVASASTTLMGNEADDNADLGIEVVNGVTDGGGNTARHNGDPRQCTNIACN